MMKKKIKAEVELNAVIKNIITPSNLSPTFSVDPPCFYCGKPVDRTEKYERIMEKEYLIKVWQQIRELSSYNWRVRPVFDQNTGQLKGKCTIKIPYCPEHINPPKKDKIINIIIKVLSFLIPIIIMYLMIRSYEIDFWPVYIVILAIGATIWTVINVLNFLVRMIVARLDPSLKDYFVNSETYGINEPLIKFDTGEEGFGPVTYTLKLEFSSLELAKKFRKANPQVRIIDVEKYI